MRDLFKRLESAEVVEQPFPYLVIENFLAPEICAQLIAELPPVDAFTGKDGPGDNTRFNLPYRKSIENPKVSELWREVLSVAMSQAYLDQVLRLFRRSIHHYYPDFDRRFGAIDTLVAKPRRSSEKGYGTVTLDSQIAINTPARTAGKTVRGPHLDRTDKLFVGLLYLRLPNDDSTGADLELLTPLASQPKFEPNRLLPREATRLVRTIPYQANTLVMFLNTPQSLHGVTPRSATSCPRYFINLLGEMPTPLFEIAGDAPLTYRLERFWRRLPDRLERMWQKPFLRSF